MSSAFQAVLSGVRFPLSAPNIMIEYYKAKVLCDECNEWHEVKLRRDLHHDEIAPAVRAQLHQTDPERVSLMGKTTGH